MRKHGCCVLNKRQMTRATCGGNGRNWVRVIGIMGRKGHGFVREKEKRQRGWRIPTVSEHDDVFVSCQVTFSQIPLGEIQS